jgi:hypothetical protein
VNDGSKDWDTYDATDRGSSFQRRRKLIIIALVIGLIIVLGLGAYVVSQTWDLWFTGSGVVVSDPDKTATSACEEFISEFPGTPCPPRSE